MYHFPLTDGSYWLYQQEQTDSLGNVTQTGAVDSVYVAGDTVIGAYTYKRIRTVTGPGSSYFITAPLSYVRDSAGYLVNSDGSYIQHDNFTDTLRVRVEPGLYNGYFFMRHPDSLVTVACGTFQTIDYEEDVYSTVSTYPHPMLRHTHEIFADGIGKVADIRYYYSQSGYIQKRLITYYVHP